MEAGIHLLVLGHRRGRGERLARAQRRAQPRDVLGLDELGCAEGGGHLEQQAQREDLLEVVRAGLEDPHAAVALEGDHALVGQRDQRLTDGGARDLEPVGELRDRVQAARGEVARHDRLPQDAVHLRGQALGAVGEHLHSVRPFFRRLDRSRM